MVIVYTAILGGCDSLKPAPTCADRCVCISDDPAHASTSRGWSIAKCRETVEIECLSGCGTQTFDDRDIEDPRRAAWSMRCLSHRLFPKADVTVWTDASFTMTDLPRLLRDSAGHELSVLKHHKRSTCYEEAIEVVRNGQSSPNDVRSQMAAYQYEGFQPAALSISCIVVRQNTPAVTAFNNLWDSEIQKHPGDNTQLSLDYCAWKTGVAVHHLDGTRHDNPYAVHDHADHKRRRKPYR